MNPYFDENIKILDLITKYPDILDYLVSLGFKPLLNPAARNTVARVTPLKNVCKMKGLDYSTLEKKLIRIIEDGTSNVDIILKSTKEKDFNKSDVYF